MEICCPGTLYLMVGASDEAFTAAKGVLDTIGSCVVRAGHKAGMGQKAKTCMQAFFSLTFQSTYEVLALGTAMGLDPATVYSILDDTIAIQITKARTRETTFRPRLFSNFSFIFPPSLQYLKSASFSFHMFEIHEQFPQRISVNRAL